MKPTPPLGLAYVAAAIEALGVETHVVDSIADALDEFWETDIEKDIVVQGMSFERIAQHIPPDVDLIGFSCMFSNNWLLDEKLINYIAQKFPKAMIIAGGESVSSMATYVLKNSSTHACIIGEGEETTASLVQCLIDGDDWKKTEGIAYKDNGEVKTNPRRNRIRDLDEITYPAWHLFPTELYFEHDVTWIPTPYRSLPMLATRGCPYTCTFCSSPQMWTTKYSLRKPENILAEMEFHYQKYGVTSFELFDLTAIINRHWVLTFCKMLQNHSQKFYWQMPAGTRSEALSSEVIVEMAKAGCTNLTFAPESGSAELLQAIQKKANPENMLSAMKTASKLNMYIYINLILGLPGETHKDIWKTIWFLIKAALAGAHDIGPGIFMPYPGTVLFEELAAKQEVTLNNEYFLHILKIDSFFGNKIYNKNLSGDAYRFYNLFMLAIFYSVSFAFHPLRVWKLFKNVHNKTYVTRSEKTAGYLMEQLFSKKKGKQLLLQNP